MLRAQLLLTIEIVSSQTMMAAVEEGGSVTTADESAESSTLLTAEVGIVPDDVFTNGDDNVATDSNFLHAGYGSTGGQMLPRKSSLIKDSSRGSRRKKTVSFSSMPGERTVVNGECSVVQPVKSRTLLNKQLSLIIIINLANLHKE